MKKTNSLLIQAKKSLTSPINNIKLNPGQCSITTVRDRLKPKFELRNTINGPLPRMQNKTKSLKETSNPVKLMRKKHSNSHLVNSTTDLDALISLRRKEIHCSETFVIDTKGNNNLNANPDEMNSISKDQFKKLLLKGIGETMERKTSIVLTDYTHQSIFTEKEKREIDSVVPLEPLLLDEPELARRKSSSRISLQSYEEGTDIINDNDLPDHREDITSSIPIFTSARSLVFIDK